MISHTVQTNNTTMMINTLDTLRSMRSQEQKTYHVSGSGAMVQSNDDFTIYDDNNNRNNEHLDDQTITTREWKIYLTWRSQMIDWFYNIAETVNFSKETIEITISIADRYVAVNNQVMTDGATYQLVCITSLYIAAKMHEPLCLSPEQLEYLGGDRATAKKIEIMEVQILNSIQWRVNPPTAFSFARLLLELIPSHVVHDHDSIILDMVQSQIELSMSDEECLFVHASTIAVASLLNALNAAAIMEEAHLSYYNDLFMDALYMERCTFRPTLERFKKQLRTLILNSLDCTDHFSSSSMTSSSIRKEYLKEQFECQPSSPSSSSLLSPFAIMKEQATKILHVAMDISRSSSPRSVV